jgi:hypothetical protein
VTRTSPVRENNSKNQQYLLPAFLADSAVSGTYQPIVPSSFITEIVLGTEQRLVEIGEQLAYLSRHKGASIPIRGDERRDWARITSDRMAFTA